MRTAIKPMAWCKEGSQMKTLEQFISVSSPKCAVLGFVIFLGLIAGIFLEDLGISFLD